MPKGNTEVDMRKRDKEEAENLCFGFWGRMKKTKAQLELRQKRIAKRKYIGVPVVEESLEAMQVHCWMQEANQPAAARKSLRCIMPFMHQFSQAKTVPDLCINTAW